MAVHEDIVDWITSEITHIGLSDNGSTEYSGGSYTKLAPTYAAASSGAADITGTLEFDGSANDGPITHIIFFRDTELWNIRAVSSESFNSDGRLDLTSAEVTSAFPA